MLQYKYIDKPATTVSFVKSNLYSSLQ